MEGVRAGPTLCFPHYPFQFDNSSNAISASKQTGLLVQIIIISVYTKQYPNTRAGDLKGSVISNLFELFLHVTDKCDQKISRSGPIFRLSSSHTHLHIMSTNDSRPPTPPPEFTWVVGRGYKRGSNPAYAIPNDSQEPQRQQLQHQLCAHAFGRNYLAPMTDSLRAGCKVLDAGCGAGFWSVDMALEFPRSEFYATDVVDLFDGMVASGAPGNVRFGLADTLKGLPFEDGMFDYCFQRVHCVVWRETEWAKVIQELVRVTKPGGWIELNNCGLTDRTYWVSSKQSKEIQ
ncbi:S-adenosyl-L-methionine-dependent methyltransferase [Endogone sp. FLAS-F59071]|nr:S-adenosyl-L-methionine-dependent methyltransferase [Endogone sp. FLAS-F59071]|eukprot:RUS19560.1 S-adenosyl-L-methionine-dependent methyltransferase [Endogone sp. FLAS-F59071]